ncbi:MAG: lysoplasmalogenase [Bacteroidota bacterium]
MLFKKYWLPCFLFLLLADTLSLLAHSATLHILFKFMLMPVLMTGLLQNKKQLDEKNWRVILAGLITAWAGDVLLLFSANKELFFILGLVCFLCTHLTYIVYFNRYHNGFLEFLKQQPVVTAIVVLFAASLLAFLWNGLGGLLIPVIVYTIVITVMVLHAVAARKFVSIPIGILFVSGAIAFILSDSILAIAKFHEPFLYADAAIMITYGIAQLLIVNGAIKNGDNVVFNGNRITPGMVSGIVKK